MGDAFDEAEFYTCRDADRLSLSSPEEAIEERLDLWMSASRDVAALIREHSPITVEAFDRKAVSDGWIEGTAEDLLDRVSEQFWDEYCDRGDTYNGLDDAARESALPAMIEAVRQFVAKGDVWRCERVATREYSADEVEAMMREHHPEWFSGDEARGVVAIEVTQ